VRSRSTQFIVHASSQLGHAGPWPPETRSFFCHFGGVFYIYKGVTMEAEAESFKSKAVSCKVDRNMGRVMILCFFWHNWRDFSNAGIFFQGIFSPYTHICTFAPVHELLKYARNWDSDIFGIGDGRICEGFLPLCFLAPRI